MDVSRVSRYNLGSQRAGVPGGAHPGRVRRRGARGERGLVDGRPGPGGVAQAPPPQVEALSVADPRLGANISYAS